MSRFTTARAEPVRGPADELELAKRAVEQHPIYGRVRDAAGLRVFMEHHVACVLDFMSLVKRLQGKFAPASSPWTPPADPQLARFLNEVVLDEESDDHAPGGASSHFEWYLAAMRQVGADTGPIEGLVERLRSGLEPSEALRGSGLPAAAIEFAGATFEAAAAEPHVTAAVFFHGREDVIPAMFLPLVRSLSKGGLECDLLVGYLERHIQVDGEQHGPLAARLIERLVGGDERRAAEARAAAARALACRHALWDAVLAELSD